MVLAFGDMIQALEFHLDLAEKTLAKAKTGSLPDILHFFESERDKYDALDGCRKRLNALIENMSREDIPEMMRDAGVRTITLDDIKRRFTVAQRFNASMPDKDIGMAWLRENGAGALIQETVNAQTLSSWAKNRIEEEGLDLPADKFKVSTMAYTSSTAVK